jgi:hypothetical protein
MTMKHSPANTADTPAQRMSFELVIFTSFSFLVRGENGVVVIRYETG